MIVSRLLPAVGQGRKSALVRISTKFFSTSKPRSGGGGAWTYRQLTPPDPKVVRFANIAGGIFWWWVFWNLFTNYGHLIGEFDFIEPSSWTDEELGIPPDDADDP